MASKTPTQHDDVPPEELADAVALLGPARLVLDRCAERRPGCADEAARMAQRIVDVIGHGVTDEPPHALVERDELRAMLKQVRGIVARFDFGAWPADDALAEIRKAVG